MQTKTELKKLNKIAKIPKIYILYTGGTIGMLPDKNNTLVPIKGNLIRLIEKLKIKKKLKVNYHVDRLDTLIDSSNINPNDWYQILLKLYNNYHLYDSFIIIHGTDTMAYTASLLSFFLRNWRKTVIVTGSQIPMFELRNDAFDNIVDSFFVAMDNIPDVIIVFGGHILKGNRSTKISSTQFEAYKTPNFPELGNINLKININLSLINFSKKRQKIVSLDKWSIKDWNINNNVDIFVYSVVPGNNHTVLNNLIKNKTYPDAIILRSYGIGNAPTGNPLFVKVLKKLLKRKIIIINSTQCLNGGVDMDVYATGNVLLNLGIISGHTMTVEAIYTKLYYLFQVVNHKNKYNIIKKILVKDIAGELDKFKIHTHWLQK